MTELNDNQLDWLISQHLGRELDRYVGKAGKRFAREVHLPGPNRWWLWAVSSSGAIAACLIVGWMIYTVHKTTPGILPNPVPIRPPATQRMLEPIAQTVAWRTVDEGVVVLDDDRPMRRVRQQVVQLV